MTGTSARENLADIRRFVQEQLISVRDRRPLIVDVGAGQGTYAEALDGLPVTLEAVEAWGPSVERLRARGRYRSIYAQDIREAGGRGLYQGVDLVIFGDVLEHLTIHDAHVVWDKAYEWAKFVMASVPNSPYPQGAIDGNHLEEHLILDPVRELIPHLPEPFAVYEYPVTNMYIWKRGS